MKRWIWILGGSLILTGCSTSANVNKETNVIRVEEVNSMEYSKLKDVYINEDMKRVILDINNLREKYKENIDERGFNSVYIDLYGENKGVVRNANFTNRDIYSEEYFNDLVQILDKSIAQGLEDYLEDMKDKNLQPDEAIIEKIGRTVVFTGHRGYDEDNYISININFVDVEDEHYREIFNRVSDGKYILDKVLVGEKLNLVEFININNDYNYYGPNVVYVRYNMLFQGEDIEKVNILIQGRKEGKLKDDDIGVFINLLNTLELNGEEKDLLVVEYKNILEEKASSKKIDLDNYNVYINYSKGNTYSEKNTEFIYFSIERK